MESRIPSEPVQRLWQCASVCPNEARILAGRTMTAEEVFQEVKKDEIFYKNSGGGVTLSGGEPLAQAEFSASILRLCKQAGLHTAIETTGMAIGRLLNRFWSILTWYCMT